MNKEINNIQIDETTYEISDLKARNKIEEIKEENKKQDNKINNLAAGTPLVASSITEMTDTTKTYVNTNDGYWYYYDGTNWAKGGVYQSTGISESDDVIVALNKKIDDVRDSGEIENFLDLDDVQVTNQEGLKINVYDRCKIHLEAEGSFTAGDSWVGKNGATTYILEPNTEYTLGVKPINAEYQIVNAVSLAIYRRDNNNLIGAVQLGVAIKNGEQKVTFTTPDTTNYYISIAYAYTQGVSYSYNADLIVTLVKGSKTLYPRKTDIVKSLPTIKKLLNAIPNIIVDKTENGDYTTVADAVANANDFDVIFVKNGVYENEIIKAWLKTVFIIGESREGVIIKNNTGAYVTPPIEMGTGLLKNLTIYAENDGTLETEPTNKGYAIHSESSVTNYDKFVIDNCTIKSDWRSAWGMGMRGNTEYIARNSDFEGVYFHDSNYDNRLGLQKIRFDNCNIIRNGNALLMQNQEKEGSTIEVEFIRTLVKSLDTSKPDIRFAKWDFVNSNVIDVTGWEEMTNWNLKETSYGNNNSLLNK